MSSYYTLPTLPGAGTRARASTIDDLASSVDTGFDNVENEISDARKGETTLEDQIDSLQGQIDDVEAVIVTELGLPTLEDGKFLTNNGSVLSWDNAGIIVKSDKTSTTALGLADKTKLIDATSGTFTISFAAAATLGNGWFCYIRNSGTGNITLDPNSTETIDGLTTFVMYPGETRLVQCTGTALFSVVLSGFAITYSSGATTFTKPPGYASFEVELWGAGGGGGSGAKNTAAGATGGSGGGGGAYKFKKILASAVGVTETVTIGVGGAGGAARATDTTAGNVGIDGANTTFGSLLTAYGGSRGAAGIASGTAVAGGGGGGSLSASISSSIGGQPADGGDASSLGKAHRGFGGAFGMGGNNTGASSGYGGGSGGCSQSGYALGYDGGCSAYGGSGGGGGGGNAASDNAGGAGGSQVGASGGGGAGGVATTSTVPPAQTALGMGGGGGYYRNTATAGSSAGAHGGIASGGGGGAAGLNSTFNSGAGGDGGDGYAIITGGAQ